MLRCSIHYSQPQKLVANMVPHETSNVM